MFSEPNIHKIDESNSSFHLKYYRKSLLSVFQKFFTSIKEFFILTGARGRLDTGLLIGEV